MKTIALANQKGGVGKTTTAASLGIGLTRQGKKVLLVDADAQGNLTQMLGWRQPDELSPTPALDALKASCGAPISMGRGEIPVRLAATSRLFCLREEIKCKAVELAGKCLSVCSTAFWLELERSVHNGDGGGDT